MSAKLAFALTLFLCLPGARAEDPTTRASDLAKLALQADAEGREGDRKAFLSQASAISADEPLLRWQQGHVLSGKTWKTYEELLSDAKQSRTLQMYRELRNASEPTVASQLKLAKFCVRSGLKKQATSHWSAILELEPDHLVAREQLGFERFAGRWIRRAEVESERRKAAEVASALRRLTPELKSIGVQLERDKITVDEAAERLNAHAGVSTIPAWESALSTRSPEGASAVVKALSQMSDPEASLSLVRHALSSDSQNVRLEATEELRLRDEHSYLPALIGELHGPWIGWRDMARNGQNQLVYRFMMVADGPDKQTLGVLDQIYFLQGDDAVANTLAIQSAGVTERVLEQRRSEANNVIHTRNEQVMKLLADLTSETGLDSPQDWWQWWDDRNEVYSAEGKPIETSYAFRSNSVVASPPPPPRRTSSPVTETKKDCLAGGTPILTQRGPVAIERVRIGDLVLAQHPDTGEVTFQPVLRTTIRAPEPLLRITVGEEILRSSGGHPFWVTGEGWVRARELRAGMRLHGLSQSVEIRSVEVEEKPTRSFNLVVADFHSYFVGPGKVLSHDNSIAGPTRTKLPGLIE